MSQRKIQIPESLKQGQFTTQEKVLEIQPKKNKLFIGIPQEENFQALQKAGIVGIFKGHGVPYKWANQTWIYPDSLVSEEEFQLALEILNQKDKNTTGIKLPEGGITRQAFAQLLDDKFGLFP